jgi:transposase
MARVEVITGVERRWSEEQKRAIVAESLVPGAVVSEVARRADISTGQIYRWRQEVRAAVAGFAPLLIAAPESATVSGATRWSCNSRSWRRAPPGRSDHRSYQCLCRRLHPPEASTRTFAGPSAARARGNHRTERLPVLRRQARQARRGYYRDVGGGAAAVEGDPDRSGEVHLPPLRDDHPATGAVSSDRPGTCRGEPVGDDPLRQVRRAPAAQPAKRELRPGRD